VNGALPNRSGAVTADLLLAINKYKHLSIMYVQGSGMCNIIKPYAIWKEYCSDSVYKLAEIHVVEITTHLQ